MHGIAVMSDLQDLWSFVDQMDVKELRRQKVKFGLKNVKDEMELKKSLFLLVKHQVIHLKITVVVVVAPVVDVEVVVVQLLIQQVQDSHSMLSLINL